MLAAAIARKVYLRKDLGVGALRREFGGRNKRRGTVPEHFAKAAGGVIRHILQQLEELQLVEKSSTLKGGRSDSHACADMQLACVDDHDQL